MGYVRTQHVFLHPSRGRGLRDRRLIVVVLLCWLTGCTHRQLSRNTALTATTVNTIQYQMVMDNIAMFACEPEALPAHVRLADGTVQISNEVGFGESGGFSITQNLPFIIEQWGPAGSSKVSEQWGTDAVMDPLQVHALQTLYRKLYGLPPIPTPNFISEIERAASDDSSDGDDSSGDSLSQLKAEEFDIPIGWFMLGEHHEVPKCACYVGRYGKRYAWVEPHCMSGLAMFTLAVLVVTKAAPGEGSSSAGLMVTP